MWLGQSASEVSGSLELILYHRRFQLVTDGARYSDGDHYFPALAVAAHLEHVLPAAKHVLVLGAGLGSIVQVIRARGCDPCFTLVEKDKTVLRWAREILSEADSPKLESIDLLSAVLPSPTRIRKCPITEIT